MSTSSASRRRPGRPATTSRPAARDQLLSAAVELFATQGVAATTFAMIAKRARLTPAMLHYYFEDRERLLDAVVEERLAPVITHVWNPVSTTATPVQLIRGIVERLLDGIERMPWIPSLWIRDVLNEGGLLRTRVLRQVPMNKVRTFIKTVERRQREGALNRDVDAALIVFSLLGLVMLHCATIRFWTDTFHRRSPTRTVLERHITSLLLDGLEKSRRAENRG